MNQGRLPNTNSPAAGGLDALVDQVRRIAREEAQRAVREAVQDAPGLHPLEMTIARWARSRGHGYATARRWVKAACLEPTATGKYRTADLDTLPRGPSTQPAPVSDLASERARRVAGGLLRARAAPPRPQRGGDPS